MSHAISHAALHHALIRALIETGRAPTHGELAATLNAEPAAVNTALHALADYHGCVLHPGSDRVWVVHPFALTPTNFLVRDAHGGEWWGNCAWCALGVAALLDRDVTIHTRLGADRDVVAVRIHDGRLLDTDFVVHFPVPMRQAWDNVIYTCSVMQLFRDAADVERWCAQHGIPRGDVQPLDTIWKFSRVWYGRHGDPDWSKWTTAEAADIFRRFGLTGDVWQLEASAGRF